MGLARRGFLGKVLLSSVAMSSLAISGMPLWAGSGFPPRKPNKMTVRQIHSGHSLTDTYMDGPGPGWLFSATATRAPITWDNNPIVKSTIPGSPLHWRWKHRTDYPDAKENIDEFELLVITEGGPLSVDPEVSAVWSLPYLEKWVKNTWEKGNRGKGAEMMLYSFWVELDKPSGGDDEYSRLPFRERLEVQGKLWEALQDHANSVRPEAMPLIYMIPGHRLVMQIYDDIEAGKVPGMTAIDGLFRDDIHFNEAGQYAVSALVYAVLYHRNPKELPDQYEPEYFVRSDQARYFKDVAWRVATSYERAGVPG